MVVGALCEGLFSSFACKGYEYQNEESAFFGGSRDGFSGICLKGEGLVQTHMWVKIINIWMINCKLDGF